MNWCDALLYPASIGAATFFEGDRNFDRTGGRHEPSCDDSTNRSSLEPRVEECTTPHHDLEALSRVLDQLADQFEHPA